MPSIESFATLYVEINLFSILLMVIIRFKTLGLSRMVAQRNFSMALDAQGLFFATDALCILLETGTFISGRWLLFAAKEIYFFSTSLVCFFWFIYFEHLQGSTFLNDKKRVLRSAALIAVMALLLIVNIFTGILFSVDENGDYHRGTLFAVQYLISYGYVFYTCTRALIKAIRNADSPQRSLLVSLALFPVLPALSGVMQYFHPELPLVCMALSLEALLMYLNWLEQLISVDPLTQLNNRKQIEYHFQQWKHGGGQSTPMYLMIVDADKFKSINDTYGHIEGDAALMRIAEAMRFGCKDLKRRASIARYGGDEFVIFVSTDQQEEIAQVRERICACLRELNRAANAPYELSVSIGVARADEALSFKELVAKADEQLYEEKKHR